WYASDQPALSAPTLPTPETGGVSGTDPQFVNAAGGDFHLLPGSPAAAFGAYTVSTGTPSGPGISPPDAPSLPPPEPAGPVAAVAGADTGGPPVVRLFSQ